MKVFVCSDIHGNIRALDAVLEVYHRECPCDFLFLGDCVGYGPHPHTCLDRILELPRSVFVMGNHEHAFLNAKERIHMSEFAAAALDWSEGMLSGRYRNAIRDMFKMEVDCGLYYAVHSSPSVPREWSYLYTSFDAEEAFSSRDFHIGFVGHTHIPAVFVSGKGEREFTEGDPFPVDPESRYIVNPGSVGQPRDLNRLASCCIVDTKEGTITLHRCPYDVEAEVCDFKRAGLPWYLADRLLSGS